MKTFFLRKYLNRKYLTRYALKKKFDVKEEFYMKNLILHSLPKNPFKKINIEFQLYLHYNAYQGKIDILKKKFINYKYHKLINFIRIKNNSNLKKRKNIVCAYTDEQKFLIFDFLYIYNFFFFNTYVDLFYNFKKLKVKKKKLLYYLTFSFTNNKIFINLANFNKKNYFFLSNGLFIKFFEKKKSFKKNKILKILIAKHLRKVFIMSRVTNIILIAKSAPIFLLEMLTFINTAIPHKFQDPVTGEVIEEKKNITPIIKFSYFIFKENISFSKNKEKKKGRIKRKILRKVVSSNKITD